MFVHDYNKYNAVTIQDNFSFHFNLLFGTVMSNTCQGLDTLWRRCWLQEHYCHHPGGLPNPDQQEPRDHLTVTQQKKNNTINLPRCHVTSCFLGKNCWNTYPSEPSWTDQLHQLVVAHVAQKVLQTAFAWR